MTGLYKGKSDVLFKLTFKRVKKGIKVFNLNRLDKVSMKIYKAEHICLRQKIVGRYQELNAMIMRVAILFGFLFDQILVNKFCLFVPCQVLKDSCGVETPRQIG